MFFMANELQQTNISREMLVAIEVLQDGL